MNDWYKVFLGALALRMKPKCYLELGLWHEPALLGLARHCEEMHGVDAEAQPFHVPENATIHTMTTNEFFDGPGKSITPPDLVFVDADHRSKQVLTDLYSVQDICADNCVVVIHDTFPAGPEFTVDGHCSDSYRVPGMIPWERVTLPFPPGVTICRMKPVSLV